MALADCNLPEDLMLSILTRLPVKSLCRFKCVCKPWLSLFSTSDFVAHHRHVAASNPKNHSLCIYNPCDFDFSFFNANSTIIKDIIKLRYECPMPDLVGSYNGLVGLFYKFGSDLILWNPATCQSKFLWDHDLGITSCGMYSAGMGFDSSANDFKVLIIACQDHKRTTPTPWGYFQCEANVYSANRDCWEKVELGFKFCVNNATNDAILSGVPYWRGIMKKLGDKSGFSEVYVRYDVKNGVFDHIPVPKLDDNNSRATTCLVEWKDSLAVLVHSWKGENVVGVMIFDECQGEWSTKFSIGPIGIPIARHIRYCKGSEILLETLEGKLFLYDYETENMKEVCVGGAVARLEVEAFNYIESLVHLKGMKMVKEIEGEIQFDSVEEEKLRSIW